MTSINFTEFSKKYPNITDLINLNKDKDSLNIKGLNLDLIKIYSQRSLQTFVYLLLRNKS